MKCLRIFFGGEVLLVAAVCVGTENIWRECYACDAGLGATRRDAAAELELGMETPPSSRVTMEIARLLGCAFFFFFFAVWPAVICSIAVILVVCVGQEARREEKGKRWGFGWIGLAWVSNEEKPCLFGWEARFEADGCRFGRGTSAACKGTEGVGDETVAVHYIVCVLCVAV